MIVIVGCGRQKRKVASPAIDLYTGTPFRKKVELARLLTADDRIFIFSGRHGLMKADQMVEPYNHKLGDAGSVTRNILKLQAKKLGIFNQDAQVLASDHYLKMLHGVVKVHPVMPEKLDVIQQAGWVSAEIKRRS